MWAVGVVSVLCECSGPVFLPQSQSAVGLDYCPIDLKLKTIRRGATSWGKYLGNASREEVVGIFIFSSTVQEFDARPIHDCVQKLKAACDYSRRGADEDDNTANQIN